MLDAGNSVPRVALVVTGEPIESVRQRRGDFVTLMREAIAPTPVRFEVLEARGGELGDLREFDGVIVTGSAASVTERAPWILNLEHRLAECAASDVFVLGVCFGHQLLAQALGGDVQRNPRGREIGTVALTLTAEDPLFVSEPGPLLVNMTHVDSVLRLPPGVCVLGRTELDPYAALRFGERVWGVQFHPEVDADVMSAYVQGRSSVLSQEGLDSERIEREVRETPSGRAVLGRFLAQVAGGRSRS